MPREQPGDASPPLGTYVVVGLLMMMKKIINITGTVVLKDTATGWA